MQVAGDGECAKFAVGIAASATGDGDPLAARSLLPSLEIAAMSPHKVKSHKGTESDLYISASEAQRLRQDRSC